LDYVLSCDFAQCLTGNQVMFNEIENLYFQEKYKSAFELCKKAAENGDPRCKRFLGWMYLRGNGCAQDYSKAIEYFSKAAFEGDSEAEYGIGAVYYELQDYRKAIIHFERSFQDGYVPAGRWLGVLYQLGLGVDKDLKKAMTLYKSAGKKGNLAAYLQYAMMLYQGSDGIWGRIKSLPILLWVIVISFFVAMRDKHSQRLM
jgi:TPR repeat protein